MMTIAAVALCFSVLGPLVLRLLVFYSRSYSLYGTGSSPFVGQVKEEEPTKKQAAGGSSHIPWPGYAKPFPRLGKSVEDIQPIYDVVVIGSGYGGGVAASRMSRAGKRVAVLERGSEKWPGEYPHTVKDAVKQVNMLDGIGKRSGLFQLLRGSGQDVMVGNGLGGTSLINANVFLRADHRTLSLEDWPEEIRKKPQCLDCYYDRVNGVFKPRPYPDNWNTPKKLSVFENSIHSPGLGGTFYRPPLALSFQHQLNAAGVQLDATKLTGNDCTGLNDGSKNSVLMTYIPDAWNWGAEIFCGVEVKYIRREKEGDGYLVFFEADGTGESAWVKAKEFVFLGAGALGTTEILLRSKAHGLHTSPTVGQKVSGNGDMLAFAYNTSSVVNGVGKQSTSSDPPGPTITGCMDMRRQNVAPNVRDGYVIQEGVIPEALAPIAQGILESQTEKIYPKGYSHFKSWITRIKGWIFGPYSSYGSINHTLTYLIMGHDSGEGIMRLQSDRPALHFSPAQGEQQLKRTKRILEKSAQLLKGVLIKAPSLTVHPLGGARMSSDGTGQFGAVNHIGQLFTGLGNEVYKGIVCLDGSIVPTSLGVNPCATITALAERACAIIIKQKGWDIDETPNGALDLLGAPAKPNASRRDLQEQNEAIRRSRRQGLKFSETLEGFIHIGADVNSFELADSLACHSASSARLSVQVDVYDVEHLTRECSKVTGTFSCGAISQDPMRVIDGEVRFFVKNDDVADGKVLEYQIKLLSTSEEVFILEGVKHIGPEIAFSVNKTWNATTTLFTSIRRQNGSILGRGILRLYPKAFLRELLSMRSNQIGSWRERGRPVVQFLHHFAGNTLAYFFAPLRTLEYPLRTSECERSGCFEKPAPRNKTLTADDGARFTIKTWDSASDPCKTPIILIPGASVDDTIFSLPTIPTNTIDYLTSHGHRCYVPILRFGIGDEAKNGWTAFDARLDVKAAMKYVREQEGGQKLYVLCHCLGSIATSMALLNGDVEAHWIAGMTCSQVFMDLHFSADNAFKARSPMLLQLYRTLAGTWLPLNTRADTPILQILDAILRFYPVGSRKELCRSSTCHRSALPFGRCFTHAHLTRATHEYMHRWFSGIHTTFLSHLMRMGAEPPHHVHGNEPAFEDLVEGGLEKLEGLRIQFISGGANVVFDPVSTEVSFERLREEFPGGGFERVVVEGYGHLDTWMGKGSAEDVYPRVLAHVRACEAALEDMGLRETLNIDQEEIESGYVEV